MTRSPMERRLGDGKSLPPRFVALAFVVSLRKHLEFLQSTPCQRVLLYRRRSRPVLRQAVAEHAGDAELYVLPTPRAVRRFIAKIASGMPDSP